MICLQLIFLGPVRALFKQLFFILWLKAHGGEKKKIPLNIEFSLQVSVAVPRYGGHQTMLGDFDLISYPLISLIIYCWPKICHSLKPIWFSAAAGIWSSCRSAFLCPGTVSSVLFTNLIFMSLPVASPWKISFVAKEVEPWRTSEFFCTLNGWSKVNAKFSPSVFASWKSWVSFVYLLLSCTLLKWWVTAGAWGRESCKALLCMSMLKFWGG